MKDTGVPLQTLKANKPGFLCGVSLTIFQPGQKWCDISIACCSGAMFSWEILMEANTKMEVPLKNLETPGYDMLVVPRKTHYASFSIHLYDSYPDFGA